MSDTIAVLKEILEHAKGERRTDGQIIDDRGLHSLPKQAYVKDYKKWDSIVAALSDAIAQLEWVPVTPDMVDNSINNVLCNWNDGTIETFRVCDIAEWNMTHEGNNQITHYRELPEPPKEAP